MDVNHPESLEVLVGNWGPACGLLEDGSLGLRLPLSGSGYPPPASLFPAEDGPIHSRLALLWYSLSPLFCEQTQQCLRLGLFRGYFSFSLSLSLSLFFFFFGLSLAIPQFALLSHVNSLRLPLGHSGQVFILSNAALASLFSPCLLMADVSTGSCC